MAKPPMGDFSRCLSELELLDIMMHADFTLGPDLWATDTAVLCPSALVAVGRQLVLEQQDDGRFEFSEDGLAAELVFVETYRALGITTLEERRSIQVEPLQHFRAFAAVATQRGLDPKQWGHRSAEFDERKPEHQQ